MEDTTTVDPIETLKVEAPIEPEAFVENPPIPDEASIEPVEPNVSEQELCSGR